MHFILTPVGSAGDVHPFVGIGRALAARGHEVTIATAGPFRALVQDAGLRFHETVSEAHFDAVTRDRDLWHPTRGLRLLLGEVATHLRRGFEQLDAMYEPGRTVLVGHSLSLPTRMLEELRGAPAATVHLAPSILRSEHLHPALAPGRDLSSWPRWAKRSLWWALDRVLLDRLVAPALNEWRREVGLAPVRRLFHDWIHSPRLVVGLFPPWFAPVQPDWPPALRLTDFPLYDESDLRPVPPSLERFLAGGPPPVLLTPGSANRSARAFFEAGLDACTRLGRRALLLTRYPEQLPPLPDSAHHERFVPLSAVLPRSAALVHHGGIGTLSQGLAAGVPQLTMPMGFDQPDNAMRLARLGVGRWVTPGRFRGDEVAATLRLLLDDPDVAAACRRWATALEPRDGLARAADLLEGRAGEAASAKFEGRRSK